MTQDEMNNEYREWLYHLVCGEESSRFVKNRSFRDLFYLLYDIPFTYSNTMDVNRFVDGLDLKYRFGKMNRYRDATIARYLNTEKCSVLEMLIALALRLEENIMYDQEIGDRTGQWFWIMLGNLGLDDMSDEYFDEQYVYEKVQVFLNREYEPDGKGGLFTIENCEYDLRDVEIWYQACWYLDEYRGGYYNA